MRIIILEEETHEKGVPVFGGIKGNNINKVISAVQKYPKVQEANERKEIVHDVVFLMMEYFKGNGHEDVFVRYYNMVKREDYRLGSEEFTEGLRDVMDENMSMVSEYSNSPSKELEEELDRRGFMGERELQDTYEVIDYGFDS